MELTDKQDKGLKKLAKSFPAFFILRYFGTLQRSRSLHTVEYLHTIASSGALEFEREDLVPAYGDVLEVVKQLDGLGLGTYIQGRKGHKTRIEWVDGTCLSKIGEVAVPEVEALIAELDLRTGAAELSSVKHGTHLRSEQLALNIAPVIEHSYQLRPGLYLEFAVPQDLSQLEAQRLAAFVGTLSMES